MLKKNQTPGGIISTHYSENWSLKGIKHLSYFSNKTISERGELHMQKFR